MSGEHVWRAFERAVERRIDEDPEFPDKAYFVDADDATAGQQIARALDDGYAVVLVSADGHERILEPARPAA